MSARYAETPAAVPGAPVSDRYDDPAHALLARLAALREQVTALVEHRTATDPTADDPLRGLYLSDDAVHHLLHTWPPTTAGHSAPPPAHSGAQHDPADRLARLAERMGLTDWDTTVLLIALAPDIDRTFEQLYGYLNDDVSRRRATVGLALDLCGLPASTAEARARFHASAPLRALGLLEDEEPERPFLSRALRVPDRLIGHLLGDDTPDAALLGRLHPLPDPLPAAPGAEEFTARLADLLRTGPLIAYLREPREGTAWPPSPPPCAPPASTRCSVRTRRTASPSCCEKHASAAGRSSCPVCPTTPARWYER